MVFLFFESSNGTSPVMQWHQHLPESSSCCVLALLLGCGLRYLSASIPASLSHFLGACLTIGRISQCQRQPCCLLCTKTPHSIKLLDDAVDHSLHHHIIHTSWQPISGLGKALDTLHFFQNGLHCLGVLIYWAEIMLEPKMLQIWMYCYILHIYILPMYNEH